MNSRKVDIKIHFGLHLHVHRENKTQAAAPQTAVISIEANLFCRALDGRLKNMAKTLSL